MKISSRALDQKIMASFRSLLSDFFITLGKALADDPKPQSIQENTVEEKFSIPRRKSRFQTRLDEAMQAASEARKREKDNLITKTKQR